MELTKEAQNELERLLKKKANETLIDIACELDGIPNPEQFYDKQAKMSIDENKHLKVRLYDHNGRQI